MGYSYDSMNRLTKITAGTHGRWFTWDSCTNGKGRLCRAYTGDDSVDYSYTPEGWVAARAFSFTNGPIYETAFAHNDMGQVTEVLYPDGNEALYQYDNGAVSNLRLKVGNSIVSGAMNVTYRPMNLAMSAWTSSNGLTNTITYDSDLRPVTLIVPGVQAITYKYDAANRMTYIEDGYQAPYLYETLAYDALGRLISASSPSETESYNYDANGNRTYQVVNGKATSFDYAATSNRLEGASGSMNASYGYGANGNTEMVDGHTAYTYGPFNRLVNADGTDFAISAQGQRLSKTFGGNATYFAPGAGGELLADDELGHAWDDYVWLNGKLVALIDNGTVYGVHDELGRVEAITNPATVTVWRAYNYPFTRQLVYSGLGAFNLGFPGQYYDEEDGLWHNGARDYDAQLGRYIEADPLGLGGGINPYAYVGNNPISNVDPLGLCPSHKCGKPPALPPGVSVKANIAQIQMDRAFAPNVVVPTLYNLVRNHGPWDYKQQNTYPEQYNAGGNFNYGATGAAAGLTSQALLRAAGAAQIIAGTSTPAWRGLLGPLGGAPYGDDPMDQAAIKAGIAYYNCLASGGQ